MQEQFKASPEQPKIFSPEMLEALTHKTVKLNKSHSLQMEPFIDLYTLDGVRQDYAEIAEKMSQYLEQKLSPASKLGFIFETALLDTGERHHWFGENSELVKASKYDDIKNGVDMIATILSDFDTAHHLTLASDLTFSQHGTSEKFNRVINDIHRERMAEVKYFHSDLLDFTGKLSNVPKTVVGLDIENLNRFLTQWLHEPELAQKQFGGSILQQIKFQSTAFSKYAGQVHGTHHRIARRYRTTATVIDQILENEYRDIAIPENNATKTIQALGERLCA